MKKISIALLFLIIGCRSSFTQDKSIVTQITLTSKGESESGCKFRIYLDATNANMDAYFYTNKDYKVGDTIYFSTKP